MTERLLAYFLACSDLPMSAMVCRDLWLDVMGASLIAGVALIGWALWRVADYRLKLAAALKAETHRMSANVVEIERLRWPEGPTVKVREDGAVEWSKFIPNK